MEHSVNISRESLTRPWGFRLEEGLCTVPSLFVQKVFGNSPSDGLLQEGDVLRYIDQHDCCHLSSREAIGLISNSKNSLQLQVYRANGRRRTISNSGSSFLWSPVEADNPSRMLQPSHNIKLTTDAQSKEFSQRRSTVNVLPQRDSYRSRFKNEIRDRTLSNIHNDPDYNFCRQSVMQRRQVFDEAAVPPPQMYLSLPTRRSNNSSQYFQPSGSVVSSTKQKSSEFAWCPSEDVMRKARLSQNKSAHRDYSASERASQDQKSQIESVQWCSSHTPVEKEFTSTLFMETSGRTALGCSTGNSSLSPVWMEHDFDNDVFHSLQRQHGSPQYQHSETVVYDDTEEHYSRIPKSEIEEIRTVHSNEYIRPSISVKSQTRPSVANRTCPIYSWKSKKSGVNPEVQLDWSRSQMYRIVPASNYDSSYVAKEGVDHIVAALPLPSSQCPKASSMSPTLRNRDLVSPFASLDRHRATRQGPLHSSPNYPDARTAPSDTKPAPAPFHHPQEDARLKQRTVLRPHAVSKTGISPVNRVSFVGNREKYEVEDGFGVSEF